jgi:hypothetical protein
MSDSVKKIKISSYDDLFNPTAADTFDDGTPAKVTLDLSSFFRLVVERWYKDM